MESIKHSPHALPDTNQSVWALVSIQMAGWISLPILATSLAILENNSFLGAVFTIIVGNAILWFIRLGILAMSHAKRQSTLDLARNYLGKVGSYFIAGLLLFSTFCWFIEQTSSASNAITGLLKVYENTSFDRVIQVSVVLGTISTLCCMGGIYSLRKLSCIAFPVLLILFIMVLYFLSDLPPLHNGRELSLSGLSLVLATNLGITSDLPTFFRHSRSWQTSIKALSIVQIISIALGIFSLFLGAIIAHNLGLSTSVLAEDHTALKLALASFLFISVICANVANIYSASVGWEILAPKSLVSSREYFILGLGLTNIFILVSGLFSLEAFLAISDRSLVNLCIVLVFGYIVSGLKRKAPGALEKGGYFAAWALASILNLLQYMNIHLADYSSMLISVLTILLVISPIAFKKE